MSDEGRRRLAEGVVGSLALTRVDDCVFEGAPPRTFGARTFGGQVVAMAVAAVIRDEATAAAPHSLHGYFLRPVTPETPVTLRAQTIRAGRSFRMPDVPAPDELPEQWPHGPVEVRVADLPLRAAAPTPPPAGRGCGCGPRCPTTPPSRPRWLPTSRT